MTPPQATLPAASPPALLLLAHGSRDRRSVTATRALARAVGVARPSLTVRYSFLDLSQPRTGPVLAELAEGGCREVVAVPLLLTEAYHSRVDVPAVLAAATLPELSVRRAGVLGPDPRLLDALARRLGPVPGLDAVVLAAAGSSDPDAVATVEGLAVALGERYGVPGRAGFASAATPVAETVGRLRAAGARRIGVASYFLAPGLLYDRAAAAARGAGATVVAPPLVAPPLVAPPLVAPPLVARPRPAAPELIGVVRDRYAAAAGTGRDLPTAA